MSKICPFCESLFSPLSDQQMTCGLRCDRFNQSLGKRQHKLTSTRKPERVEQLQKGDRIVAFVDGKFQGARLTRSPWVEDGVVTLTVALRQNTNAVHKIKFLVGSEVAA